ncbi:MAG: hypothetical protein LKG25_05350 [Prevotella sp.]|jgi:hypothetical protein|nr:hypothetical protein [Prevotella sp.]MCI1282002.1 hypothetical protein [Prevotella sp.]
MEKRKKYECPIAAAVTMDNTNPLLVGSDKSGTVRKDYQNEDVGTEGGTTNNGQEGTDGSNQFVGF